MEQMIILFKSAKFLLKDGSIDAKHSSNSKSLSQFATDDSKISLEAS